MLQYVLWASWTWISQRAPQHSVKHAPKSTSDGLLASAGKGNSPQEETVPGTRCEYSRRSSISAVPVWRWSGSQGASVAHVTMPRQHDLGGQEQQSRAVNRGLLGRYIRGTVHTNSSRVAKPKLQSILPTLTRPPLLVLAIISTLLLHALLPLSATRPGPAICCSFSARRIRIIPLPK